MHSTIGKHSAERRISYINKPFLTGSKTLAMAVVDLTVRMLKYTATSGENLDVQKI